MENKDTRSYPPHVGIHIWDLNELERNKLIAFINKEFPGAVCHRENAKEFLNPDQFEMRDKDFVLDFVFPNRVPQRPHDKSFMKTD